MTDLTIAEIKARLIDMVDRLAEELAPGGHFAGATYSAKNPTRADRKAGSFVIQIKGAKAGGWVDYATGDKGDVIDLIAYANGYCDRTPPSKEARVQAIQWAKNRLGLAHATPAEIDKTKREIAEKQKERIEREAHAKVAKERKAFDLFLNSAPIGDTVADAYLRSRGIALAEIPNLEASLKFRPRYQHWEDNHVGPAMIAAVKDPAGTIVGVHVTWLRPDGQAKADVGKPKMMFGSIKGNSIRLTKGFTGLTPEEAAAAKAIGDRGISEGIENGLSVAMACPELRIHAAGSIANIGEQAKLACVSSNIILADNDLKPEGQAALERARVALERHGDPVVVARAWGGAKDFNELL